MKYYDRGNQLVCRNRISPLTRILTDGDSQNTAHALAEIASNHSAAALSAACSWLAITVQGQRATVAAGGPAGKVQCGSDFDLPNRAAESQGEALPEPLEPLSDPITSRYLLRNAAHRTSRRVVSLA